MRYHSGIILVFLCIVFVFSSGCTSQPSQITSTSTSNPTIISTATTTSVIIPTTISTPTQASRSSPTITCGGVVGKGSPTGDTITALGVYYNQKRSDEPIIDFSNVKYSIDTGNKKVYYSLNGIGDTGIVKLETKSYYVSEGEGVSNIVEFDLTSKNGLDIAPNTKFVVEAKNGDDIIASCTLLSAALYQKNAWTPFYSP